jgi:2,5-furandicarboxylate decarboxylase 1
MFNALKDYPNWRMAGGLITSRKRLALAMGTTENDIPTRLERGLKNPIEPVLMEGAPCQEVVHTNPDLSTIPYPLMHVLDGGPYISATFVVSKDPELGRNIGSYRLMYRTPTETGIDLVSPSDMRLYYQRQFEQGKPLEIAVAIGVHPFNMLAASYKAPIDTSGSGD